VAETIMAGQKRWLARLTPEGDVRVEGLLGLGYSLDVWEVEGGDAAGAAIIVAADEEQLMEVEKQGHARVERLSPLEDFDPPNLPPRGQT
jgi:hypothetical protein